MPVQGSVEISPLVGLADIIVDLVETGATLTQNGLEEREDVARISSLLVVNRAAYKLRRDRVGPFIEALRSSLRPPRVPPPDPGGPAGAGA